MYVNWGCPRAPGRCAPGAPMGVAPRAHPRCSRSRGYAVLDAHPPRAGCAVLDAHPPRAGYAALVNLPELGGRGDDLDDGGGTGGDRGGGGNVTVEGEEGGDERGRTWTDQHGGGVKVVQLAAEL